MKTKKYDNKINKVYDMFGQQIRIGSKVLYLKSRRDGIHRINSVVKDIKITPMRETVILDCGAYWGTKSSYNEDNLLVVDKLGLKGKWLEK